MLRNRGGAIILSLAVLLLVGGSLAMIWLVFVNSEANPVIIALEIAILAPLVIIFFIRRAFGFRSCRRRRQ